MPGLFVHGYFRLHELISCWTNCSCCGVPSSGPNTSLIGSQYDFFLPFLFSYVVVTRNSPSSAVSDLTAMSTGVGVFFLCDFCPVAFTFCNGGVVFVFDAGGSSDCLSCGAADELDCCAAAFACSSKYLACSAPAACFGCGCFRLSFFLAEDTGVAGGVALSLSEVTSAASLTS